MKIIGNIFNNETFETFYNQHKILTYTGFKKLHPHDTHSILRIAFKEPAGKNIVKDILTQVIVDAIKKINDIKGCFNSGRK